MIGLIKQNILGILNTIDNNLYKMNDRPMPRIVFLHVMNNHLYDNECLFMARNFLN